MNSGRRRVRAEHSLVTRLALVVACLLVTASAHAEPLGEWQASALHVSWAIGQWGEACGPRPAGGADAGGKMTVARDGNELAIQGLGRNYRTTQCWEQFPGLSPRSHSGGGNNFSTTCKTTPGDPRQATVKTTWALRGDALYFDEQGQYQFVVQGQNCTASVRRTRVLHRIQPEPAPAPATPPKTPEEPEPAETSERAPAAGPCAEPGPPTRLEVLPASKLMLPGETFRFAPVIRDAHGCRVGAAVSWSILEGEGFGSLSDSGELSVGDDARDGQMKIRAAVGERFVDVTAHVVSRQRYDALLDSGEYLPGGVSKESATTTIAGAAIDTTATAQQKGSQRSALGLLAAGIGLLLVSGGLLFWWRGRSRVATAGAAAPAHGAPTVRSPTEPVSPPPEASPRRKVCPVCGEQYPAEAEFCGADGASLLPMN